MHATYNGQKKSFIFLKNSQKGRSEKKVKSVSNQQLRRRPVYSLKDKIIIDQLASEKFYHISCKNYVVRNWPEAPQLSASPLAGGCGDCAAILRGGNCWVVTIQVVGCVGNPASNLLRGMRLGTAWRQSSKKIH